MKHTPILPLLFVAAITLFTACNPQEDGPLSYYGLHEVDAVSGDTVYHSIRDFSFIDQDSQLVTNQTFAGKAYIADFFFTSCPTICPKVKKEMLRIYDKYAEDDRIMLLSHSIDPKRDTVGRLKQYALGLGVEDPRWRFVTGSRDSIYEITADYMSIAEENADVPGGFDHSGYILLIDKDRHIRAYADGTKTEKVTEFIHDIDRLLLEMEGE